MKKYLAMLCSLMMLTAFASCGNNNVKYETDYLSFEYPSNWEIENNSDSYTTFDSLKINTDDSFILFVYSISDLLNEKLTTAELKKKYEKNLKSNEEITNTFVKNGQAYILITDTVNNSKSIEFQTDKLNGSISFYSAKDEELVMKMIDSIEFY